nr:response regulator [Methylomarinum sp. Ch1-1]MDP4519538.1 response regulator [Methylomarinum sp. Ch1-1]
MSRYSALFTGGAESKPTAEEPVKKYSILLVDDEPHVLSALRRVFRRENYHLASAMNGQEALQLLAESDYQVIISDFKMPKMNGAELLRQVKEHYPPIIRIMLTGHADTDAVMGAINEGAVYKFIIKPWNDDDLRVTVGLALEQYDLIEKIGNYYTKTSIKAEKSRNSARYRTPTTVNWLSC